MKTHHIKKIRGVQPFFYQGWGEFLIKYIPFRPKTPIFKYVTRHFKPQLRKNAGFYIILFLNEIKKLWIVVA